jgi:gamma-glutamyltranspeptidase/glutathione hydrolase
MPPLDFSKLHPSYQPQFSHFPSRRSTIYSAKGAIATSQPLGEYCGDEELPRCIFRHAA